MIALEAGVRSIKNLAIGALSPSGVALHAMRLVSELGPAEHQALVYLVRGCSLKTIAREMNIPSDEAVLLKASLMEKLGAGQTADIIRLGIYARVDEID